MVLKVECKKEEEKSNLKVEVFLLNKKNSQWLNEIINKYLGTSTEILIAIEEFVNFIKRSIKWTRFKIYWQKGIHLNVD